MAALESQVAAFNQLTAQTAEITTATISGTLFADNINDFDGLVATAVSNPTVLDTILGNVPAASEAASLEDVYSAIAAAGFSVTTSAQFAQELANLDVLVSSETVLAKQAGYFESYFEVNGNAQFNSDVAITSNLIVGDTVIIGDGLQLTSGALSYQPADEPFPEFAIQPAGTGSLSLFAGLMTLDETGIVTITGDLSVAGKVTVQDTLFTDLLAPTDFGNPFQVQVAGAATDSGEIKKSRFEIVNELGTPVATISAEGSADFAGEVRAQSLSAETVSAQNFEGQTVTTTNTSGRITLPAGEIEITIENEAFTADSIISITPVGSTQNQVVYIKAQTDPDQESDTPGTVVVGIDQPITTDISFNWWISN